MAFSDLISMVSAITTIATFNRIIGTFNLFFFGNIGTWKTSTMVNSETIIWQKLSKGILNVQIDLSCAMDHVTLASVIHFVE